MSNLVVSFVVKLIDQAVKPLKAVSDGVSKMAKSAGDAAKPVKEVGKSLDAATAPAKNLAKEVAGVGEKGAGATPKVRRLGETLDSYSASAQRSKEKTSAFSGVLGQLARIAAGVSLAAIVGGFLTTSAQFEAYQTTLETVLGSAGKAKAAMAWVQNFAKTTPYELAEVTDAFVKLNAYGIDPQVRALKSLGNAASAMNKPLDQAVEALADAQTFQFERLKEFGITTMQQGNRVALSYILNGKQMTVVTQKSALAVQKALLDIFDARFAGAMDRQAGTFNGIVSNLKDTWTGLQKVIGDQGFFAFVKDRLGGFLETLNRMSANGQLAVWAKRVSDALVRLFDAFFDLVASVDWVGLINFLTGAAVAVAGFIKAFGGFKNVLDLGIAAWIASIIIGMTNLVPVIVAVASALFGLELAAGPITLVILAVGLLAAAAFLVWRNWDKVKTWFLDFWSWMKVHLPQVASLIQPWIDSAGLLISHWSQVQSFFDGLFTSIEGAWNRLPKPLRDFLGGAALKSGGAFLDAVNPFSPLGHLGQMLYTPGPSQALGPSVAFAGGGQGVGNGHMAISISDDRVRVAQLKSPAGLPISVDTGDQVGRFMSGSLP